MKRLAIIASHPIQYYAPWFRHIAQTSGFEIKVFYLWPSADQKADPKFKKEIQWDIPLTDGYDFQFVENISFSPGTHHFWGMINPKLIKEISTWNPDAVLFTTLFYYAPLRLLLHLNKKNIPCLFRGDSHLLNQKHSFISELKISIKSYILKSFSACLPVGEANAQYFKAHGVSDENCFHTPHCVDNNRFSSITEADQKWVQDTRKQLKISESHFTFLFVGKFDPIKRPLMLAKQFSKVSNSTERLIFIGDGKLKDQLKSASLSDPRIHILPFQNQSRMPAVYRLADCLVLPSESETWGLCVNEAMASGIPAIVSSRVGCGSDLIISEQTGWSFDADQPEQLGRLLSDISAHPENLHSMQESICNKIHEYSYKAATRGLIQALGTVL